MKPLLACVVLSAVCLHGYGAFPADSSSNEVISSTIATSTGSQSKDDKLSARFGLYEEKPKPLVLPAVATKLLGGSESSSVSSASSSSVPLSSRSSSPIHFSTPSSLSSSSSFSTATSDSVRIPIAPHYEYPNWRPETRPCTCCKPSCGGPYQGPIASYPRPLPFPGFNAGPYPGFSGGAFSGSKSSSSSFANQNFGGGSYYPSRGYASGFPNPPLPLIPIYPSGSGSTSSSSSFSGGHQGRPGLVDRPYATNFPVQHGSSSASSASSSSSAGQGGSSSWSSSQSSSSSGTKTPTRPIYPPQEVTPEFTLPEASCRSSIGC